MWPLYSVYGKSLPGNSERFCPLWVWSRSGRAAAFNVFAPKNSHFLLLSLQCDHIHNAGVRVTVQFPARASAIKPLPQVPLSADFRLLPSPYRSPVVFEVRNTSRHQVPLASSSSFKQYRWVRSPPVDEDLMRISELRGNDVLLAWVSRLYLLPWQVSHSFTFSMVVHIEDEGR